MINQAFTEPAVTAPVMQYAARSGKRGVMHVAAALCTLSLVLSGCGGGGGSDDIAIGGGQGADPVVADYPIFYVKRPVPPMTAMDDVRRVRVFQTGADLYMRERASPSALEVNITGRITAEGEWDIKDVDVSYDGKKVIFAMRGPLEENQEDDEPPTWNVWEYVIETDDLHRVIASDVVAEEGHDVSPHYLPDPTGRIVFMSTRQHDSKAILIDESAMGIGSAGYEAQDEDGTESAFVLHVMDADGSNIDQITYNQSHDLDPTVLADGRLMWSRWDHANDRDGIHLYTGNPDGTDVQLLYGAQSHNTGTDDSTIQFVKSREMQDGRVLALVRPVDDAEFGGDLHIIDVNTYVENNQPTAANLGMDGPAQTRATANDIRTIPGPSPGGRYNSAVPLWDGTNRVLTSWSQCRLTDTATGNVVPCTSERVDAYEEDEAAGAAEPRFALAPTLYSVWMFDPADNTLKPVVQPEEGVMITDMAAAQPRTIPSYRPSNADTNPALDATLRGEGVGILDIRSVYDFDGEVQTGLAGNPGIATISNPTSATFDQRQARFLRIEKAVSMPDEDIRDIDGSAFGASNFMRQILGYVPIEPDGSVRAKVPANVAFQISVLDRFGRRLPDFARHNAWLQLRPGEVRQCNGCHVPQREQADVIGVSHGRSDLFAQAYAGAGSAGQTFPGSHAAFASAAAGDTMAQARATWSCSNEQCRSITPSVDLIYSDVWPAAKAADPSVNSNIIGAASHRYLGSDGLQTSLPTALSCTTVWSSSCRIVINYLQHIQPMWDISRPVDQNGDTVPDIDNQCTSCHSPTDAMGAVRVPAGQLDLSSTASVDPGAGIRVTSYQNLLFAHNAQELNATMTALQDICVQTQVDPVSGVPVCVQFQTVNAPMTAGSARTSTRFFSTMNGSHASYMTRGELRLISEWLDIGAQYYNDPFAAPEN